MQVCGWWSGWPLQVRGRPHVHYLLALRYSYAVIVSLAGLPACALHTIYNVLKHYIKMCIPNELLFVSLTLPIKAILNVYFNLCHATVIL